MHVTESGLGYIETPDFNFSISVSQSQNNSKNFELLKSLDQIKNTAIVNDENFNEIFDEYFDTLSFSFKKAITITEWIDKLEAAGLDLTYAPTNQTKFSLTLDGSDTKVTFYK